MKLEILKEPFKSGEHIHSNPALVGQTSTKNLEPASPHPPFGHLLPKPGEKGKRRKFFRRGDTINLPGVPSTTFFT